MARSVGTLFVNLVTKTQKFEKGMKRAQKATASFKGSILSAGKQLMAFGGIASAVSIGGMAAFIRSQLTVIDLLAKTSEKLGIATDDLGRLQYAATLTGVTTQTFNMALQRMTRRIAEAAVGTGEAKNALVELKVSAQRLARIGPYNAFLELADAMGKVDNQAHRVRLSMKLFDSEGVALVNTLAVGSEGLRKFGAEANKIGFLVDPQQKNQVVEINDAMTKLSATITGLGRTILFGLIGPLQKAVDLLQALAENPLLRVLLKTPDFSGAYPGGGKMTDEERNRSLHRRYVLGLGQGEAQLGLKRAPIDEGVLGVLRGFERIAQSIPIANLIPRRGPQPLTPGPSGILGGLEASGRDMARIAAADQARAVGGIFGRVMTQLNATLSGLTTAAAIGRKQDVLGQRYAGLAERGTAAGFRARQQRNEPMKEMSDTMKQQLREVQIHTGLFKEMGIALGRTIGQVVTIPSL